MCSHLHDPHLQALQSPAAVSDAPTFSPPLVALIELSVHHQANDNALAAIHAIHAPERSIVAGRQLVRECKPFIMADAVSMYEHEHHVHEAALAADAAP